MSIENCREGPIRIKLSETIKCPHHECDDNYKGRCFRALGKTCDPIPQPGKLMQPPRYADREIAFLCQADR